MYDKNKGLTGKDQGPGGTLLNCPAMIQFSRWTATNNGGAQIRIGARRHPFFRLEYNAFWQELSRWVTQLSGLEYA